MWGATLVWPAALCCMSSPAFRRGDVQSQDCKGWIIFCIHVLLLTCQRGRLLPSAPPGETPRLSRPSWRDFISAAWPGPPWGLLQVGCDQNKAASFQCGGAAGLLWAPHKQTASSFLFVAWSNKMTNCSTHVYKLEAVKHCMHQTGAFSFLYLSASCRWTAFCWLWNYWFGVRKTLWSEPEKHHGHTDKSTFCSHSATSVQNPFWV